MQVDKLQREYTLKRATLEEHRQYLIQEAVRVGNISMCKPSSSAFSSKDLIGACCSVAAEAMAVLKAFQEIDAACSS